MHVTCLEFLQDRQELARKRDKGASTKIGRFCGNTRCLGNSELFAKNVYGHSNIQAGKTGWDKLMMTFENHLKTELFHEGNEEILKDLSRGVTGSDLLDLSSITNPSSYSQKNGPRQNKASRAMRTVEGTVPGMFNV